MKRYLKIIFVFNFAFFLSENVHAVVKSYTCGENCTATLDEQGRMQISGSGAMTNWAHYSNTPWYSDILNVKELVIDSRITNVGNNAFLGASNLKSVTIPSGVTTIGVQSFWNSGLQTINLPDTLTSIGDGAFNWSPIHQIDIPSSVTDLGDAFRAVPLVNVVIPESVSEVKDHTFSNNWHMLTLTVGENTKLGDIFTYTDGVISVDLSNVTIYCTGDIAKCKENAAQFSDNIVQASRKEVNGITYVYDKSGKLVAKSGSRKEKRIYTMEEAAMVAGKKNTVMIRYK